jgi:hypothetical protein
MAITIQSPRPNAAASPRNIPRGCFRRIPHTTRTSNAPTHRAIAMVAGTCCALPSLARACPSGEWPALEIRAQTIGPRTPATVPATTMAESFFCTTPASRPDVAASDACLARPLCLPDGRWALADRPPSDVGLFRGPRTSTCPPRRRFSPEHPAIVHRNPDRHPVSIRREEASRVRERPHGGLCPRRRRRRIAGDRRVVAHDPHDAWASPRIVEGC